jgi:hypothetical protein
MSCLSQHDFRIDVRNITAATACLEHDVLSGATMTKAEVIDRLRKDLPYLHETFGLSRIGLFGSFASGRQTDASDVDLVLEFEHAPGMRFVELTEHIERILRRKVDALTNVGISAIRNERIVKSIKESVVYV